MKTFLKIFKMLHIKPPAQQALLEALIGVCGTMRDTSLSSSVVRVLTRIPMGSPTTFVV